MIPVFIVDLDQTIVSKTSNDGTHNTSNIIHSKIQKFMKFYVRQKG